MLAEFAADEFRLLTFRATGPGPAEHRSRYLALGLSVAWLAGIGRYWDDPRAEAWQAVGLGSVVYVFCLAALLWILVLPLGARRWTYGNVLLFTAMTAPPALLYAIPVERFLSAGDARAANAWFLGVVAAWRVALLAVFLRRTGGLDAVSVFVGTFLPITLVVFALAWLNLEHVVFRMMGGLRPDEASANDDAYGIVITLAFLSIVAAPLLALLHLFLSFHRWREGKGARGDGAP